MLNATLHHATLWNVQPSYDHVQTFDDAPRRTYDFMPILAAPRSKHRDDAVQTLAVAVVLQAARDLTDPSEQLRAQARRDIADGGLDYWLSLLDLNADGVKRRLLQLKAGAGMLLGRWMLPRSSYTPRKTPVRKRKAATLPAAGVEDASELRAGVQI